MMKNSLSVTLINRRGQATIISKMRKNSIDNICPPTSLLAGKKRGFFSPDREKVGGEKGGVRRLWECGKRSKGVVNSESFPWAVHLAVLSISQDKNTTVLTCVVRGKKFTKKLNTES